jgi:clan AA aspartic protease (TIGR02281 family)
LTWRGIPHKIALIEEKGRKMNRTLLIMIFLIALALPASAQMYKWVDEKGTVHFTDDPSNIPERYRPDTETRKAPTETPLPGTNEKQPPSSPQPVTKIPEPKGFEITLSRKNQILFAEALLNRRLKRDFVVDTGASFTLIDRSTASDLGITVDEYTPFIPIATASDVILTPLVTLKSVLVGQAEMENVDALIYTMPAGKGGLLGNSFLGNFRVVLDSVNSKMTLYPAQGIPSSDRPGGYDRDYWVSRFRYLHYNLEVLNKLKATYERKDARIELNRVNNAIRFFENQLSEWERKASYSGVPHNWRD